MRRLPQGRDGLEGFRTTLRFRGSLETMMHKDLGLKLSFLKVFKHVTGMKL